MIRDWCWWFWIHVNAWLMGFFQKHLKWRDISEGGVLYMRRFYLIHKLKGFWKWKTRFHVFVHYIARSDYARDLHDHPWDFLAIRLTGFYWEVLPSPTYDPAKGDLSTVRKLRWPLTGHFRRAEQLHRIELVRPVWTLFVHWEEKRDWGFQTQAGWVRHDLYPRAEDPPKSTL